MQDAGLPLTLAPQQDFAESERIKTSLRVSGIEYSRKGVIKRDPETGEIKRRPANQLAPQWNARPKAEGIIQQPAAVHRKHIMTAQIVDHSAPMVEDPVTGRKQQEIRENRPLEKSRETASLGKN